MPEQPPPARSFPRLAASVAAAVAAAAALRCRADGAAIFTGRSSYAAPARVYFTAAAADRGADGALRPHSGTVRAVLKDPSRRIAGDYSFSANSLGAVSGSFALPPDENCVAIVTKPAPTETPALAETPTPTEAPGKTVELTPPADDAALRQAAKDNRGSGPYIAAGCAAVVIIAAAVLIAAVRKKRK